MDIETYLEESRMWRGYNNYSRYHKEDEYSEHSLEDMLDKPQDWKLYYIDNNIEFDEDFHNYE